jgi:hypothetical protein
MVLFEKDDGIACDTCEFDMREAMENLRISKHIKKEDNCYRIKYIN